MSNFKKFIKWIGVILLIVFLIIIFNQIISFYRNLSYINPLFAIVVTLGLVGLLIYMIAKPIIAFTKYSKLPELPENYDDESYRIYLEIVLNKLKNNRTLLEMSYEFSEESVELQVKAAFDKLKDVSQKIISRDANVIFLSTAISQNGVFDTITVFVTLLRMVYDIACVYENRPSLSRIVYLYIQIASAALIAGSIEDMDIIDQQLEPILTSLLGGSFISAIPGGVGISTFVINSIVQGSVNALLSLRVGVICQRYLSATVKVNKKLLRKGASMEAASSLESVIRTNASYIVKEVMKATKKATIDKFKWKW